MKTPKTTRSLSECRDCKSQTKVYLHRGFYFCDECLTRREERMVESLPAGQTIPEQMSARSLKWVETVTRPITDSERAQRARTLTLSTKAMDSSAYMKKQISIYEGTSSRRKNVAAPNFSGIRRDKSARERLKGAAGVATEIVVPVVTK